MHNMDDSEIGLVKMLVSAVGSDGFRAAPKVLIFLHVGFARAETSDASLSCAFIIVLLTRRAMLLWRWFWPAFTEKNVFSCG